MKKALIVLSGGQDSTTCLFFVKKHYPGHELHAITFNYGQRHDVEISCARTVAEMANVKSHEIVELPEGILAGTSPLTDHSKKVGRYDDAASLPGGLEDTFVPGRNLLFLAIAANRAYVLGADMLVTGVAQEDFGGYPDCRDAFIKSMQKTIFQATDREIEIQAPLMYLNKCETVKVAVSLPGCLDALANSHTCYNGEQPPCGKCHSCLLRAKGFEEAGIPDPMMERLS
ncbi:7-cyano-7-deazaguanine synthase QueC [Candidatus Pacearchaeota archaeon]|nr:7-cyano-7-deazaguanine synthase QueC [Candidatus Pacearchaeota archaeon]